MADLSFIARGMDAMSVIHALHDAADLTLWEAVPNRVRSLYKSADRTSRRIKQVIDALPGPGDQAWVYWHPTERAAYVSLPDAADEATYNRWENALRNIDGVEQVSLGAEWVPQNANECVRVKQGAALDFIGKPLQWASQTLGGPNTLTNTLVGSLVTGGLGYGTGAMLEHLFPEQYVQRGRLRKTLGLAGAGLGAVPGLWHGSAVSRFAKEAADLAGQELDPQYDKAANFAAASLFDNQTGAMGLETVPVDAFNNAVWMDVRRGLTAQNNPFGTRHPFGSNDQPLHTTPELAAATTGLMRGIQAMRGGDEVLRPMDLVHGIASAGVGLAAATVAGKALSALAGLSPAAQAQLQTTGAFAGMLSSIVPPLFGR